MFIINHKKIFFVLSTVVVALSLFSVFFYGLNPSIEFTGGAITEIQYAGERPDVAVIERVLTDSGLSQSLVQTTGESSYIIRTKDLQTEERQALLAALSLDGTQSVSEERYSLVGPSIGKELRKKAWIAIALVLLVIILFIAFAFRGVSRGDVASADESVSSWHYSAAAVLALAHDIVVPTGIFAFLGSFLVSAQIDALFVTALLAILGYSINDTIVVFDRVRENLKRNREEKSKMSFEETVGESLRQTYARSINTSLTTLLVLVALFFVGGESTKFFALVLAIGVIAGTYSSLFLASPLLVALANWRRKHSIS